MGLSLPDRSMSLSMTLSDLAGGMRWNQFLYIHTSGGAYSKGVASATPNRKGAVPQRSKIGTHTHTDTI